MSVGKVREVKERDELTPSRSLCLIKERDGRRVISLTIISRIYRD